MMDHPPSPKTEIPPRADTPIGPRTGIVLSSGFFGFFAHAGFLSALRDAGVVPDAYSGASSGAIVAAMAASGMSDKAIRQVLFHVQKADFWDPDPWHKIARYALRRFKGYTGYLKGGGFSRLLEALPARSIEACQTPLGIAATNLTLKRETIFTRGDLIRAIHASGAVPMLFKPVEIDGNLYVDGGISNKAPVKAVSELASLERIIVHFIASENVEAEPEFLNKPFLPWHIQYLAVNIGRQDAYRLQVEMARMKGIEVIEIKTDAPPVGPNRLHQGPAAFAAARETTMRILKERGFSVETTVSI